MNENIIGFTVVTILVADRAYRIAKNQEQLSACLMYICIALLVWAILVTLGGRKGRSRNECTGKMPMLPVQMRWFYLSDKSDRSDKSDKCVVALRQDEF